MKQSVSDIAERVVRSASALLSEKPLVIVAIDGRCASGKTTLSRILAERLSATVVHMDDFFLPPARRNEETRELLGANAEIDRFLSEVLLPLSRMEMADYRPFSCKRGEYLTRVPVSPRGVVIVEGSYSCHPLLRRYYDLTVFLTVLPEEQLRRLEERGGRACLNAFRERWIPLEEAYFSRYDIADACDIVAEGFITVDNRL